MSRKTTRREFLRDAAVTGIAVSGVPFLSRSAIASDGGGKSRVVITTDKSCISSNDDIVFDNVKTMLEKTIASVGQKSSAVDSMKSMFSKDDVVGIKVNTLFGPGVSTRPEIVEMVIDLLYKAGVDKNNIIVWDNATQRLIKGGFTINKDADGPKVHGEDGDWGESIQNGAFSGRISKILSEKITALINMPILKHHSIAGISCALKNHYGSFDNPGEHHGNHCNPAMADFSAINVVKEKTRLVIVDALRPQIDKGPGHSPKNIRNAYTLLASTDPVAVDHEGLKIIQSLRKEDGMGQIGSDVTGWKHSAATRGVGTDDDANIEVIQV